MYVLNLLAHYVQRPMVKTGVCFVMKSEQGAGKGYIVEGILRHIFGPYYRNARVAQALGRFNFSVLHNALLLFLDETGTWDHKTASDLKALITSPTISLEEKGLPLQLLDNNLNIIMATNSEWACPMESTDRRYFVVEVSNERCGKTRENDDYWNRAWAVPPEAVYKTLMTIELGDFNPRLFPITKVAREQKEYGLCSVATWWLEEMRDENERLFGLGDGGRSLNKGDIYGMYTEWKEIFDREKKITAIAPFWKTLRAMLGSDLEVLRDGSGSSGCPRPYMVRLPSLDMARRYFAAYVHDKDFFMDE